MPEQAFYLSMDRTNWQWGKSNLNFLVLSACYKGVAIPLYWVALNKKGNSDTAERIGLMNLFMTGFGSERLLGLLADREFVGHDWFKYLEENKISFDIRIKKNYLTINTQGSTVKVDCLFHGLKPGEFGVLPGKRIITGRNVFLSALRLPDGDLLIVATDRDFEETRLTDLKRIEAMFRVLSLAFSWAHKVGDWRYGKP